MSALISLNSNQNVSPNCFMLPNGTTGKEAAAYSLIPEAKTIKKFSVRLSSKQPLGKNGYEFTLRSNGCDTALNVQVTNGEMEDISHHSLHITRMSLLSVQVKTIGTPIPCLAYVSYILE